jgi:hypothetical protein
MPTGQEELRLTVSLINKCSRWHRRADCVALSSRVQSIWTALRGPTATATGRLGCTGGGPASYFVCNRAEIAVRFRF